MGSCVDLLPLIPIIPQRTVHVLGGHGQESAWAWAMTDGKSTGDIGLNWQRGQNKTANLPPALVHMSSDLQLITPGVCVTEKESSQRSRGTDIVDIVGCT